MKRYLIALLCSQAAWSGAAMADASFCRLSIGNLATAIRTLPPTGASDQQTWQASSVYYRAEDACRGQPLSAADRGIFTMAAHKLGRAAATPGPAPGEEFGKQRRPKTDEADKIAAGVVAGVAGAMAESALKTGKSSQAQSSNSAVDAECNKPFVPPPKRGGSYSVRTCAVHEDYEKSAQCKAFMEEGERYNKQQAEEARRSEEEYRAAKADYDETQSLCKQRRILGTGQ